MPQPSKEQVREWLVNEVKRHRPPPTPAEVRRALGWELIEAAREKNRGCGSHVPH